MTVSSDKTALSFFVMIIMGAAFIYMGGKDLALSLQSSSSPEEISLTDLIKRGPEGNPYLLLTDFTVLDDYFVPNKRGKWKGVWVAVVSSSPLNIRAKNDISVLIYSGASDKDNLYKRCNQHQLRGMVGNEIIQPTNEEIQGLEYVFKIDFSKTIIFCEGREPAGFLRIFLLLVGGAVSILLGAFLIWYSWSKV